MSDKEYLRRFFEEKDNLKEIFEVETKSFYHIVELEVIVNNIMNTSPKEQKKIRAILTEMDFKGLDINHFLNHLAKGLANKIMM